MASRMIQNNFGGGEISPTLFGRSDLAAYYKGAADAENFVISKEGTLRKRHGISSLVVLDEDYSLCRIIPYKYDRTEGGFVLLVGKESGDIEARFHGKDGTLRDAKTIEGVLDVSTGADAIPAQMRGIQSKQIGDQLWITNGSFFRYLVVTDNATITVMEWVQAGVPDGIRHDDAVAAVSTHWSIERSYPYTGRTIYYGVIAVKDSVNSETSKGDCAWSTTWSASTYINLHATIAVADKAKWDYVIFCKRSGGTYGELTRVYMDDTPDVYLYTRDDATLAQAYKWSDGKWYDKEESSTTTGETEVTVTHHRYTFRDENHTPGSAVYGQTNVLGEGFSNPLCIDCFQQRRVFANGATESGRFPMTMWFSEVGNINNFYADRPSEDDDAFSPTISSTGPSFIRWIVCYQDNMILLTDSGLFSVGFAQTQGFSASTCRVSRFSQLSVSADIQPVVTDAGIVFVGGDNKTLYTASFDLQENTLKPINRSVLVEHLTRSSRIVGLGLQEFPDNVVWVATDDGKLCTFTFERNEEVYAWSHSRITGASVLDVVSLGTVTDSPTGASYRSLGDLVFVVEKDDAQYVCAFNHSFADSVGTATTNVVATLKTLRPESQERSISGMKKNVKDIIVRLYETGGISVRNAAGTTQALVPAKMAAPFTGDVKVMPRGLVNEEGQLTLVSDNASACEVLQIVTNIEVEQ